MNKVQLSTLPKIAIAACALMVLNVIVVLVGEIPSRMTIVNKTSYFMHITIGDILYPYVAPEGKAVYETHATPQLKVYIIFSPGQGMGNKKIDTTITMPYTPASTTTSSHSCDCGDSVFDCSTTSTSPTPAQGSSKVWEVALTDFH